TIITAICLFVLKEPKNKVVEEEEDWKNSTRFMEHILLYGLCLCFFLNIELGYQNSAQNSSSTRHE
ncbi:hypothetical protein BLOT_010411, partial [Blomia tropicalis]